MANKFSILDLMNQTSMSEKEREQDFSNSYTEIELNYEEIKITNHNKYSMDQLQEMATGIHMEGELQQPLVLARINGEYWLISGHRRMGGIDILVKEGMEQYRNVPCRYKDMDETQFRIALLCGNTFNRKMTDYDYMIQSAEWREVLEQAQREGSLILKKGERIRDFIALYMGKATGTIGTLNAINKNATEEIKEELKNGTIATETAYQASRLPEEDQKEIVEQVAAGEQINSDEIRDRVEEKKNRKKQESAVSDSDTRQKKIDKKTAKILRDREDEEKMRHLPSEENRKHQDIIIPPNRYEEITDLTLDFLLLKNDNYKTGDVFTLQESADGKKTDRKINAVINYVMKDRTGLEDDYCIIGFEIIDFD